MKNLLLIYENEFYLPSWNSYRVFNTIKILQYLEMQNFNLAIKLKRMKNQKYFFFFFIFYKKKAYLLFSYKKENFFKT